MERAAALSGLVTVIRLRDLPEEVRGVFRTSYLFSGFPKCDGRSVRACEQSVVSMFVRQHRQRMNLINYFLAQAT
jgi:hypothetical protein